MSVTAESESRPQAKRETMDFDVIIVGAGIAGINAAYRIQTEGAANLDYVILEDRESVGGTWDLFRYPGIRSDSDIFTFGFPWNPWARNESLASGDDIQRYIMSSAQSTGIYHHISFRHRVVSADWCSAEKNWKLQVHRSGETEPVVFRARWVLLGTGYYNYEQPRETVIPGIENFVGEVIHPQFWPRDFDYTNKDIALIGSGATAITILPSMADRARRVTMIQRSPGYIVPLPTTTPLTTFLLRYLPGRMGHFLNRFLWLLRSYISTRLSKQYPGFVKGLLRRLTTRQLPPNIKWDPNFKPHYNPWEQRLCVSKNGDFFAALRSGKADVVTDTIKRVSEKSIELDSGDILHPDIIITATGLKLRFGGGISFSMDGQPFEAAGRFAWRAAMLQDVPNMLFMTGYENASWTLGADVNVKLFLRIAKKMTERGATVAVPRLSTPDMAEKPMMSLSSTYLKNASEYMPKGGTGVWSPKSGYFADLADAKWGNICTDLELT